MTYLYIVSTFSPKRCFPVLLSDLHMTATDSSARHVDTTHTYSGALGRCPPIVGVWKPVIKRQSRLGNHYKVAKKVPSKCNFPLPQAVALTSCRAHQAELKRILHTNDHCPILISHSYQHRSLSTVISSSG